MFFMRGQEEATCKDSAWQATPRCNNSLLSAPHLMQLPEKEGNRTSPGPCGKQALALSLLRLQGSYKPSIKANSLFVQQGNPTEQKAEWCNNRFTRVRATLSTPLLIPRAVRSL